MTLALAGVGVLIIAAAAGLVPARRAARAPALIRASDPDVYAFIAPLSGQTVLSQAGRDIELRPGWMALRSSGRPFEVHIASQHDPPG